MARSNTSKKVKPADPDTARNWTSTAMSVVSGNAGIAVALVKDLVGDVDGEEACDILRGRIEQVKGGDLSSAEAMLTAQAAALNSMFIGLAGRACQNMGEQMEAMETYMRLALKAQSQCRATLEALAAIKNPPVVYARQANFAAGHQQVNNGELVHTGKLESQPNKLLEADHGTGERLDPGAAGKAGGSDQTLATVGAIDGSAHG